MRRGWRIAATIVLVAWTLAWGCGRADGPSETVERFYERLAEARVDGNEEALALAREIMDEFFVDEAGGSSRTLEVIGLMVSFAPMLEYRNMRYDLMEEEGDDALVHVSGTMVMHAESMESSEELDAEFPLMRVDGTWRIKAMR